MTTDKEHKTATRHTATVAHSDERHPEKAAHPKDESAASAHMKRARELRGRGDEQGTLAAMMDAIEALCQAKQ